MMASGLLFVIAVFISTFQGTCGQMVGGGTVVRRSLSGDLLFITLDGVPQYLIREATGTLVPLGSEYRVPATDASGKPVLPGSVIQLDCNYNTATSQCVPDASAAVSVLAGAPITAPAPGTSVTQSVLVMILDYPQCGIRSNISETTVRQLYLGPNQDGNGGLAQKFAQCSYGNFKINPATFRAVVVPHLCSTAVTSSCSWWAISTLADMAARTQLGSAVFATFTHYTYVLPPSLQTVCPWSGLALLPGRQTWFQTSSYGIYRWATAMQESIHNYGLWHSWQGGVEYNDYSTAMGRGDACPNAAEISRMGWATPAIGGDRIDLGVLQPGAAKLFTLPATYLTGNNNYLRVQPNWLPSYTATGKNLYIAVRVAKNGDAALSPTYAGKVNVHEVNATMDNAYPASYTTSDRRISFIGAISPMSQMTFSEYKLVVYGGSWVSGDYLRVYVCRFVNGPSECPSIQSLEGGGTKSPSPPPPKSPLPPPPPPRLTCPAMAGYTVAVDKHTAGYNLLCEARIGYDTTAMRCNADARCKAFKMYMEANGSVSGCTKSAFTLPLDAAPNVCFYTKVLTNCSQADGHLLTPGADHGGDDISCEAINSTVAGSRCAAASACKGFSTVTRSGRPYSCTKSLATPLATSAGCCFYTKFPTGCPAAPGFTVKVGQDLSGGGGNLGPCATLSLADVTSRCKADPNCKAFSTKYSNPGALTTCTKTVASPTVSSAGTCFYVKS